MKRIVWDWNGTLFDDVELCFHCINSVLTSHHCQPLPDVETYRNVFGFPIEDYYRELGFDFSVTPFSQLAKEYMELYQKKSYQCCLVEDAQQVLSQVQKDKIHQTILSASKKEYLDRQIQAVGLSTSSLDVYGIQDIYARSKLALAREYQKTCRPDDEIWFIGDSLHDHEVADALGAHCLLVTTGHQSRRRLAQSGVPVLDSLKECLEVVYG